MNDLSLVDMMIVLDLGPLEVEVIAEVNGRTAMMMADMRGMKGGGTVKTSVTLVIMTWYVSYSLHDYCFLLVSSVLSDWALTRTVSHRLHPQPLL
jgi:hypothetical protein